MFPSGKLTKIVDRSAAFPRLPLWQARFLDIVRSHGRWREIHTWPAIQHLYISVVILYYTHAQRQTSGHVFSPFMKHYCLASGSWRPASRLEWRYDGLRPQSWIMPVHVPPFRAVQYSMAFISCALVFYCPHFEERNKNLFD
jgi:hypothetical protein